MPRAMIRAPLVAFLWAGFVASAAGQGVPHREHRLGQDNVEAAVAAISASLDVERDILRSEQELYADAAAERDSATGHVASLLAELDGMVQGPAMTHPEALAAKDREIADAESKRVFAIQRCRELMGRILEIQARAAGLEKKLVALREVLPKANETLTGSWRVTYMPGMTRGVFVLRQSGTIVQGQYQLEGGWKGSLQGTLVDGKIYLQRIDSKLGRSSELEGYLGGDGGSIRGTWRNYNITDGAVASGAWTASRQEDQ